MLGRGYLKSLVNNFRSVTINFAAMGPMKRVMFSQRSTMLLIGTGISSYAIQGMGDKKILNEVLARKPEVNFAGENKNETNFQEVGTEAKSKTRLGGILNYRELSIGSLAGLFLGILVGKLNSALVFLTLSAYLVTQFLEKNEVIRIPWGAAINLGTEKVSLKKLILHEPNFKISFVLSFLIAAFNV